MKNTLKVVLAVIAIISSLNCAWADEKPFTFLPETLAIQADNDSVSFTVAFNF